MSTDTTTMLRLACFAAFSIICAAQTPGSTHTFSPTNYTSVQNIFIQDSASFNSTGYNVLNDSFGLIDKSSSRWSNLTSYLNQLNAQADNQTAYKLVFIARHGQGYHNLAESTYGTPAWNCYLAQQFTDGNITWGPDARLTPLGQSQAQAVNAAWKTELNASAPLPQTLYVSPLTRCTTTLNITWSDILLNQGKVPNVIENLRESLGLHTCDQRSNKSYIESLFPTWNFEPGFPYHDIQWGPIYEEQSPQQTLRTQRVLNDIFATDNSSVISITAHGGTIGAFLSLTNHRSISIQPGGLVPVLVKAVSNPEASNTLFAGGTSATAPLCTANPTAALASPDSISGSATVYSNIVTTAPFTTAVPLQSIGSSSA